MKNRVYNLQVEGKRVVVRVDFNVPLKDGVIQDDNRIVQALPTIKFLVDNGAKVILLSHLGKIDHKDPEKKAAGMKKNNMAPIAVRLGELLNKEIKFVPVTRGEEVENTVASLENGDVMLLQNTRYEKGESKNDPELSAYWAQFADAFVMDAFGSCHRAHSSTYGIPEILNADGRPTALGYLVEKEVVAFTKCVNADEHPYVAILGGVKVSDKIKVIEGLLKKADKIIIGGAMAYTFLKAKGLETGNSRVELDQVDFANRCMEEGKGKLYLPVDFVVAERFDDPQDIRISDGQILEGYEGLDIGPKTREMFKEVVQGAKVIFWNGPMGVFENELFDKGTKAVCEAIANVEGVFSVIGGGDSASAAAKFNYKEKFSHVSTGGGASLEMIENDGHLPGIDVIAGE